LILIFLKIKCPHEVDLILVVHRVQIKKDQRLKVKANKKEKVEKEAIQKTGKKEAILMIVEEVQEEGLVEMLI
jgi:hypothetical protein